jgi:hypothetical protein
VARLLDSTDRFRCDLLKALGLPPDMKTRGFRLDFPLQDVAAAEVHILLLDEQFLQARDVLLRYRFTVSGIEVGPVVDLLQEEPGAPEASEAAPPAATPQPIQPCHDPSGAPEGPAQLTTIGAPSEVNATMLLAPLVARAGGSVTLSAAEMLQPWSLSTLELPDGSVTLVAVVLGGS